MIKALSITTLLCFLTTVWGSGALARPRPPQEAFNACKEKRQGNSCQVQTPHGRLTGNCRQPPAESQLACIPNRRQSDQNRHTTREGRPTHRHTTQQTTGLDTVPLTTKPQTNSLVEVKVVNGYRIIQANGIPNHLTGNFPNNGNPNKIRAQSYSLKVSAKPKLTGQITPLSMRFYFGIGTNGIPFDPGADEWYLGNRGGKWQYEALSGAIALGIDDSHAHVQPNGAYHYHGLPTGLLGKIKLATNKHSPLVGWAADGFPIYAMYGYQDGNNPLSDIIEMKPSYQLREGSRPSGKNNPGGIYDGTFLADYEYKTGSGVLDECNGRITITPEFPKGTYAYFLTADWPVIPRCHKGAISQDFAK
ncbi:YHYH protein [Spartinivicinus ruber]|uniref:YHYH protein n=1 Tax=Spartinivicinus ruber TaxID=2683272 RepID=UPI0013D3F7D9|nr:YHYH protein [Spartinivicinus ruber]